MQLQVVLTSLVILTTGHGQADQINPAAPESIWIEAEHLRGVHGNCFPDMTGKTDGHWGMSGPGIAPEWTQGGESEWASIACSPDDDKATATYDFEVPEAGEWTLWVRYRDWREQTELFAVRIEQDGQKPVEFIFGERPVVDENDELKLYWKWAFGWDSKTLKLAKGPAKLVLLAHAKQPGHRQVDCFCLTQDKQYHPYHREKPATATTKFLDDLRAHPQVAPKSLSPRVSEFAPPAPWKLKTFHDRGFVYLWNTGKPWQDALASNDVKHVLFPFHADESVLADFHKMYGGKPDVPIFSDPRIVPAFHGAGPNILDDALFVKWLDEHPDRPWANMMNYTEAVAMTDRAKANWPKYRERYVGNIAGESIGYFNFDSAKMNERIKSAKSRTEILDILTETYMAGSAARQKAIFGEPGNEHYQLTIPCQSSDMLELSHACREWGARTVGYENQTCAPSLALRMAFLRGGARQYGGMICDYRSCNFGDASTIFANQGYFYAGSPRYVYDNSYDVWAGAGMTWYKFDIWLQYMSGTAMFYHEQGHDEFWMPGGNSVAPQPLQLSPKGKLVENFLQVTRKHPDRGTPFTPIAFLLDRAHGWDATSYQPTYFGLDQSLNPAVLGYDRHARMLREWFKVAYHPFGPKEAELNTGINPTYLPGVFGNIFDVLVTSPTKLDALDSYPVVVLNGELNLTAAWGKKLAAYLHHGGTLVVSADQLSGPGVAELKLPDLGKFGEDNVIVWKPTDKQVASQRYRYQTIKGGKALATASNGDVIAATSEHGKGRMIFLSIPRGLGIDSSATPLVALALVHARQGLMPVEVEGDVEWLLNRTDKGWIITLLNPAGSHKPQHGVVVTDYSQQRAVTIRAHEKLTKAMEWFDDANVNVAREGNVSVVRVTIPAGGVRIVEVQ